MVHLGESKRITKPQSKNILNTENDENTIKSNHGMLVTSSCGKIRLPTAKNVQHRRERNNRARYSKKTIKRLSLLPRQSEKCENRIVSKLNEYSPDSVTAVHQLY